MTTTVILAKHQEVMVNSYCKYHKEVLLIYVIFIDLTEKSGGTVTMAAFGAHFLKEISACIANLSRGDVDKVGTF